MYYGSFDDFMFIYFADNYFDFKSYDQNVMRLMKRKCSKTYFAASQSQ